MKEKQKLHNVEFIRSLAAIGIICFHYACGTASEYRFMFTYANGSWGDSCVILFFVLSGGLLYLNNEEILSIKVFYYKRFKAIFPSFYIAYLFFFLENVIKRKLFFYNSSANPFTLILTIIGMDGYFNYAIPNYYILGEWFLGAIIILYIIYPILLKGMTQNFLLTSIFVTSAFLSVIFYNVFVINPFRNVFVCILPFYFGMILFKYKNLYIDNIFINCISMVGVVILSFCHIPSSYGIIIEEMYGIMLFIVLYSIGNLIMKLDIGGKVKKISDFIGSISFQIFLLQHVVIFKLQSIYNPVDVGDYWKMLTLTIVITIVTGYSLKKVSVLLVHTKQYQKLENYILKINERKD